MKFKSLIISAFLTLGFGLQASAYSYETVKGDPMQTRIYTLPNGLKVYLSVNKEKPRIQTYIAVRTGSRNDPAETTGLAHYLEHLMFKGTHTFGTSDYDKEKPYLDDIERRYEHYRTVTDPAVRRQLYHEIDSVSQIAARYFIPNEYDKLMSSIGANGTNAYTSNDVTCYVENIPSNEVDNWARIQGDRFQNMVIRGFHTELEAVYEEFNISLTNDTRKEFAAIGKMLFPTHPYGTQTTIGTQDHLKNPSITNIKNYFKHYYVPNNVAICMAGDFDPDKVIATIDRYFGSWKKSDNVVYPQFPVQKDLTSPVSTTVIGKEAENIMMAWKMSGAAELQNDTLSVISQILSNGKAGLFDIDINQPMRCQGAQAFNYDMRDYSQFIVFGMPNEGQSLDDVKNIILAEIEKLKNGEFSDKLLPAIINNMKLDHLHALDDNESRADKFVNAFINGRDWQVEVQKYDRLAGMTKQQIVDFARRHFTDGYAIVYKKQGEDASQKKIDKPAITAIPTNRDMQSAFVKEIKESKVEPIQPRFLDFNNDFAQLKTKRGLPVYYIQNKQNQLFDLNYYFEFGEESNKWLPFAKNYFDYLSTDKLSAQEVQERFYGLACNYGIFVGTNTLRINLNGLGENMTEAMKLMEQVINNAKIDNDAYKKYVEQELKSRRDNKLSQKSNFRALQAYGQYGAYNPVRNIPDSAELVSVNPQKLIDMVANLKNYKHSVLYYGPLAEKQLIATIDKNHAIAKKLKDVPAGKPYTKEQTPKNEIWIAPYDAKNIYMIQYHNENQMWNPEDEAKVQVFNEYFGGGMNGVVFQELRESRGLAYSAFADFSTPVRKNDSNYAYTYIISQNDKMMDCIHVFNNILDTLPQTPAAFELAKQATMKRIASQRITKTGIIYSYLSAKQRGIDYDIRRKVYTALPSLTLEDIVKFEHDNMAKKPWRYLILGDEKNLDIKSLEKIAPIKRVSTDEIFGY
ncbi:M16 family metallopeptidase [Prevotella sp.]|uniref:M16 family metallopeptidase n=1 Tax=Prevotella sp. TaxID=59823 RepID=UPI0027E290E1|nr:insulinase family protein [Prevotella sp.]